MISDDITALMFLQVCFPEGEEKVDVSKQHGILHNQQSANVTTTIVESNQNWHIANIWDNWIWSHCFTFRQDILDICKTWVNGDGVSPGRLSRMMCYHIKHVENSKLMVYEGCQRKCWTLESDKSPRFGEIFTKSSKTKDFWPIDLSLKKGLWLTKGDDKNPKPFSWIIVK